MNMKVSAGLLLCGIVASSVAMADCPNTMPEQLLTDCIVNEGAGHGFPPSGYVYMDVYQNWLKAQQTEQAQTVATSD